MSTYKQLCGNMGWRSSVSLSCISRFETLYHGALVRGVGLMYDKSDIYASMNSAHMSVILNSSSVIQHFELFCQWEGLLTCGTCTFGHKVCAYRYFGMCSKCLTNDIQFLCNIKCMFIVNCQRITSSSVILSHNVHVNTSMYIHIVFCPWIKDTLLITAFGFIWGSTVYLQIRAFAFIPNVSVIERCNVHVAVLYRNRKLFQRVYRSDRCLRSAVSLNFR